MASFFRQVAAVIVIAFAALLVYSFLQQREVRTQADAVKIVLEDIGNDPTVAKASHAYSVFSTERDANGQWQVIVKVTLEPHSLCPTAFIRTYQLLPIRHGVDKTITRDCRIGSPIAFPEEAIVAAGRLGEAQALQPLAKACGYELPLQEEKARAYCSDADLSALQSFAQTLSEQAKWLVEVRSTEKTLLIALDAQGNSVQTRVI